MFGARQICDRLGLCWSYAASVQGLAGLVDILVGQLSCCLEFSEC